MNKIEEIILKNNKAEIAGAAAAECFKHNINGVKRLIEHIDDEFFNSLNLCILIQKTPEDNKIDEVCEIIKYLIDKKNADIECNIQNKTPIIWACEAGFLEAVKILVERGADTKYGAELLNAAARFNRRNIIDYLLNLSISSPDSQFIIYTIMASNTEALKKSIKVINSEEKNEALACATSFGKIKEVEILLEAGADPFYKSKYCGSPYAFSKMHLHREKDRKILDLFLKTLDNE